MKGEFDEQFKALVRDVVTPTLRPRGYRRSHLRWTRSLEVVTHEIVLQRAHGNTHRKVQFFVEACVTTTQVYPIRDGLGADAPNPMLRLSLRMEELIAWPSDRVTINAQTPPGLPDRLRHALEALDDSIAPVVDGDRLAQMLRDHGYVLDLDLFAWTLQRDGIDAARQQYDAARARFGTEDRWPRLAAGFERLLAAARESEG